MLRIRKVVDDRTPANRSAIAEAQEILRTQFSGMPPEDIGKLPDQLRDPLKYRFVSELFIAENSKGSVQGLALLLYAPDLNFCYLETISAAIKQTGKGLGAALYDRVRDEAAALGAKGLYFECLPDDPLLSPDPVTRKQNAARLRFYERYGARPIEGTAYETPVTPGDCDPPYLVFDGLGHDKLPAPGELRAIIRAILERKYGNLCPPDYVKKVVKSVKEGAVRLRPFRYIKTSPDQAAKPGFSIPLVINDGHDIHHVNDRGYVQAPVRIKSILQEIEKTGLFARIGARHFPDRHIRAVHDAGLVNYIERACKSVTTGKSIYPYVFPIRNAARPPKETAIRAGYYCIDTFTPLNANAYAAARGAVNCALTAAEQIIEGNRTAYALVRPPGHHAERKAFGGFCYFNNAAIAAHYLSQYGRVAVLDIDYHHGNGTQDIFYDRADVLTISIHGHPSFAYPYFSGFKEETGIGPGTGFNLNIPLPETTAPEKYRVALKSALGRIGRFDPDYLVLAMGFDTGKGDPTGTWSNRAADFEAIGRMIGEQSYPTLVVQEGGYRVRTLGINARRFFSGLANGLKAAKPRLKKGGKKTSPAVPDGDTAWRSNPRSGDVEAVQSLTAATGYFNKEETQLAAELVAERLQKGKASGYDFVFAERGGRLAGYACFGPIAGTDARYDLYWIAVHPDCRRQGLGAKLMAKAEKSMAKVGAKRIYIDTSGKDLYAPTRAFYRALNYKKIGEIPDFYHKGDAKVLFAKDLAP